MSKIYQKQPVDAEHFDGSQNHIFGKKVIPDNSLVDALTHKPIYYLIFINEDDPDDPEEEPNEVVFEIGDWIIKDGEDINVIADDTFKENYEELLVIPKFVADWIEECKNNCISIANLLCSDRRPEKVREWMEYTPGKYKIDLERYHKYQELVAKAWIEGYQVEE